MKLKTRFQDEDFELGEIVKADITSFEYDICLVCTAKKGGKHTFIYSSLDSLKKEWEDYEEPKDYYFIRDDGSGVGYSPNDNSTVAKRREAIGNYFVTREEATQAVEKLKAWKRLKDKGFRFILDGETEMPMFVYSGANGKNCITSAEESKQCRNDIKLLFGGEE